MLRHILTALVATAVFSVPALAQQEPLPAEFGMDAGIQIGFDDPQTTLISVPIQAVRAGFYLNEQVSVEPRFGLNVLHTDGATFTQYDLEVGSLLHFAPHPVGEGLFARPFVGVVGTNGGGFHATQALVGIGLGLKIPFATRLATRMEVNYAHLSASSDAGASNQLGILIGLSFFNR